MSVRNDISGMLRFVSREATWRERLRDVVAEHLLPALGEFNVDRDELAGLVAVFRFKAGILTLVAGAALAGIAMKLAGLL